MMLVGGDGLLLDCFALAHRRQTIAILVIVIIFGFGIKRKEAIKSGPPDLWARNSALREPLVAVMSTVVRSSWGGFHLAGQCAAPDQGVEFELFVIEILRHLVGMAANVLSDGWPRELPARSWP